MLLPRVDVSSTNVVLCVGCRTTFWAYVFQRQIVCVIAAHSASTYVEQHLVAVCRFERMFSNVCQAWAYVFQRPAARRVAPVHSEVTLPNVCCLHGCCTMIWAHVFQRPAAHQVKALHSVITLPNGWCLPKSGNMVVQKGKWDCFDQHLMAAQNVYASAVGREPRRRHTSWDVIMTRVHPLSFASWAYPFVFFFGHHYFSECGQGRIFLPVL